MFKQVGDLFRSGLMPVILAAAITLGTFFGVVSQAFAEASWAPGDRGTVGAYCSFNQDSDIESFMRAIEQGGMAAYKDMMESPRLPCYDARTQGIPPTGVELVRYIRDLTYTNGSGNPHTVEVRSEERREGKEWQYE